MGRLNMKAYVIEAAGGLEKLQLKDIPVPQVKPGWIRVKIKAFGLNRSEWFTRIGESPTVKFPRVLGIECVGEVADSLDNDFSSGQKVAVLMGGMGRDFDGSYAEYTLVPKQNVFTIETNLAWAKLAALPEMLQTTHGSLYQGLAIENTQTLLIRGGTSSVGLCALAIAKNQGLKVFTTTRSDAKVEELKALGADGVLIDNGELYSQVDKILPGGFDRVLELIGTTTLLDSLKLAKRGGIVCMTGILGGQWELANFRPMGQIPTAVRLTSYSGEASDLTQAQLQHYIRLVEQGELKIRTGRVFAFDELVSAHQLMDANQANGKLVVTV
jgi:NADPH:quinone reductase